MKAINYTLAMLFSIVVAACGGGGSSNTATSTTALIGISASGNPVANGVGYALDAVTGTKYPFTTDANGNFNVGIPTTAAGPFLVHVTGLTSGGTQSDAYSIITKVQLDTPLNVTPLSNIVLASAAGVLPQNLETTCTSNQAACSSLLISVIANLAAANTAVANALGCWRAFKTDHLCAMNFDQAIYSVFNYASVDKSTRLEWC